MPTELDPDRDLDRGRTAAYADLVAAVLDLRSSQATRTFDQVVNEAVTDGRLALELARELKWLQRQTLLDLVDHAERVLPTTIVALEGVLPDEPEADASLGEEPAIDIVTPPESSAPAAPAPAPPPAPAHEVSAPDAPAQTPAEVTPPSVDLTARRLLVAGLRTIDERPFP